MRAARAQRRTDGLLNLRRQYGSGQRADRRTGQGRRAGTLDQGKNPLHAFRHLRCAHKCASPFVEHAPAELRDGSVGQICEFSFTPSMTLSKGR